MEETNWSIILNSSALVAFLRLRFAFVRLREAFIACNERVACRGTGDEMA